MEWVLFGTDAPGHNYAAQLANSSVLKVMLTATVIVPLVMFPTTIWLLSTYGGAALCH